ncbi:MAG: serine peptidase [Gammaproteobacteria bacterium]|nr:MAG: serine peptidase [Gammaproteobacteria bacterium]
MINRILAVFFLIALSVPSAFAELPDFTKLIADNSSAVVKIKTVEKVPERRRQEIPQGDVPDIFRDLFGQRNSPQRRPAAMGSGFIISSDGFILTNNHVIGNAHEISIRLSDRRDYKGTVVGVDPRSDLALLKIDATDLPTVTFAGPDNLKVGEWVVAIGSPFGLDFSASAGIVSAIGRSIPTARGEDYVPFIQSDVAINPGNSGGPLFNLQGEVIGINSQIYTRSGGSIGLSFAIPVNVALEVVAQLKDKGYVDRGWLGVYIQDVDKNLAESLGLKKSSGALIAQVEPGSAADKAGMMAGDVVIKFNGQPIDQASDLPHAVGLIAPGKKVPAVVVRKGKERKLNVTVGARPGENRQAAGSDTGDVLGLVVEKLTDEMRNKGRLPGGVIVSKVYADSPAVEAGLQAGDVIVQVGYRTISDLSDYNEVLEEIPHGTPVALRFFRRGRSVFRTIEVN